MQLLDLFEDWQNALSEFNTLLKKQVKANRQTKVLARIMVIDKKSSREKALTRSSYNARLLHPHYWPLPLVEQFAEVLACPQLLILYQKQSDIINQLPDRLTVFIKSANASNAFVIRLLGINQASFYTKQKDPKTWRKDEIERIEEIIETVTKLQLPGGPKLQQPKNQKAESD